MPPHSLYDFYYRPNPIQSSERSSLQADPDLNTGPNARSHLLSPPAPRDNLRNGGKEDTQGFMTSSTSSVPSWNSLASLSSLSTSTSAGGEDQGAGVLVTPLGSEALFTGGQARTRIDGGERVDDIDTDMDGKVTA